MSTYYNIHGFMYIVLWYLMWYNCNMKRNLFNRVWIELTIGTHDISIDLHDGSNNIITEHNGLFGAVSFNETTERAIGQTAGVTSIGSQQSGRTIGLNIRRLACDYYGSCLDDILKNLSGTTCELFGGQSVLNSSLIADTMSTTFSGTVSSGDCDCDNIVYEYEIYNNGSLRTLDNSIVQSFDDSTGDIVFTSYLDVLGEIVEESGDTYELLVVIKSICGDKCTISKNAWFINTNAPIVIAPNAGIMNTCDNDPTIRDRRIYCLSEQGLMTMIFNQCGCLELFVELPTGEVRSTYITNSRFEFDNESSNCFDGTIQLNAPSPYWMGERICIEENELVCNTATTPMCLTVVPIPGSPMPTLYWRVLRSGSSIPDNFYIELDGYIPPPSDVIEYCTEPDCYNRNRIRIESSENGSLLGYLNDLSDMDAFVLNPLDRFKIIHFTGPTLSRDVCLRPRFLSLEY